MSEAFEAALRAYDEETERVRTGIRACFCPPMADSSDPEQHEVGCLGAEAIRIRRHWDAVFANWEYGPRWDWQRSWSPPAIPAACYEASFGMVHVRPGCRCPR